MSYVTDLVMLFPGLSDAKRFEQLYEGHTGGDITPVRKEVGGTKIPLVDVYVAGLNYVNLDLLDALEREPWRPGTVLYYHPEADDTPTVKLFGVTSVEGLSEPGLSD